MLARDGHVDLAPGRTVCHQLEAGKPSLGADAAGGEVCGGVTLCAEGDQPPRSAPLQGAAGGLHDLPVIQIHHRHPVGPRQRGVAGEGLDDLLHVLEVVHVLQLCAQQNRHGGVEVQKGIHVLAGLKEEMRLGVPQKVRAAHGGVGSPRQDGGVYLGVQKDLGAHGGAGAFAVHTRHTNAVDIPRHESAQIVGAGDAGDAPSLGLGVFGIILRNGHRIYHQPAIRGNVFGGMTVQHRDPTLGQGVGDGGAGAVGAADGMPRAGGEQCQRGHHHPADADEEDGGAVSGAGLQVGQDAGRALVGVGRGHGKLLRSDRTNCPTVGLRGLKTGAGVWKNESFRKKRRITQFFECKFTKNTQFRQMDFMQLGYT